MTGIDHRFYEKELPDEKDLVVVEITSIEEMGVYCSLVEYNRLNGFIPNAELSVMRIKSVAQVTRVKKIEVVQVIRVDKEKRYVDLSKRAVDQHVISRILDRLNKSKTVHSIINSIHQSTNADVDKLYTSIAYPLARKFGHALDGFRKALLNEADIIEPLGLDANIQEALMKNIHLRLKPQPVKVSCQVAVTCYAPAGVNAIKEALKAGEKAADEYLRTPQVDGKSSPAPSTEIQTIEPVEVKVSATPLYTIEVTLIDREKGKNALKTAILAIQDSITKNGGEFDIRMEPQVLQEGSTPQDDYREDTDEDEEDEDEEEEEEN
ncbi:putative Eukaryotic translation initiation factor 2 subunit alpha [Blattamonas nauphoetae]|uniref:Eukaryotic translation initiation factor 2 subunit alpha n=1 Tax=Blattamonas nauphoetae TaxID=2049346 RepID=A0ABQ9YA01_9EUKA|nr:putative Eukaryotic translation initiation factor 2 subunit alpha [Blattamonas nauphoetae]